MTNSAAQKRADAIQAVTDLVIDPENGYQVRPEMSVSKAVKAVRDLAKLGRTPRWHAALKQWESMILECDDFEKQGSEWRERMHWAILQGGVYALHAGI